ncbi:MAG: flagellar protein, FliL [Methanobrevibacter sp.]|uniref:flagellar protein, FliL n=1 Tax=Methanobrevibacter sp. TaxID=66852 RepID=UPI003EFD27CB
MKNYVIILIGVIIALIIVVGAIAYTSMQNSQDEPIAVENNVSNATNVINATTATSDSQRTTANSDSSGPSVVSEDVKFNKQAGEGYYREVNYDDGNFRQYDVDTGKLIGSSYDSDQDKLPSME